jgi:hypothetical protein
VRFFFSIDQVSYFIKRGEENVSVMNVKKASCFESWASQSLKPNSIVMGIHVKSKALHQIPLSNSIGKRQTIADKCRFIKNYLAAIKSKALLVDNLSLGILHRKFCATRLLIANGVRVGDVILRPFVRTSFAKLNRVSGKHVFAIRSQQYSPFYGSCFDYLYVTIGRCSSATSPNYGY